MPSPGKKHAIPSSAWEAARVIHTRTEKVSESLTWAAARLAPPAPPMRAGPPEDLLLAALGKLNALGPSAMGALLVPNQPQTVGAFLQSLPAFFDYNTRYLEYVALYETYLGHLRRLERVHKVLERSSVEMPSGTPLARGPNDTPADTPSKPGYGLVATPFPPTPPSPAAALRRKAKRARQRAAKRLRAAEKHTALNDGVVKELASQIRLAKVESAWTKVERKKRLTQKKLRAAAPKGGRARTAQGGGAAPQGGRPPPSSGNRKARRYAIYGVPTATK